METSRIPLEIGTFDQALSEITTPTGVVRLSPCEARLLVHLAANPGRAFSVDALQRAVWGHVPGVNSRTAYVTLGRLRAKIERDPEHPRHLLTTRHVGYRFEPLGAAEEDAEAERLIRRLEALGYRVSVEASRAAS